MQFGGYGRPWGRRTPANTVCSVWGPTYTCTFAHVACGTMCMCMSMCACACMSLSMSLSTALNSPPKAATSGGGGPTCSIEATANYLASRDRLAALSFDSNKAVGFSSCGFSFKLRETERESYREGERERERDLPSLTQMADPECKTNLRAQRSFAQVTYARSHHP